MTRRNPNRLLLGAAGVLVVLIIWQLIIVIGDINPVVLPGPGQVVESFGELVIDPQFWRNVATSLSEFVVGFVTGGVLGILIGLLVHEVRTVRGLSTPIIETLRFIVPFAWIPLTILWFGTSFVGKAWLVSYAVFFVMLVSTVDALRHVDPDLVKVGTTLGMSRIGLLVRVRLRAAAPILVDAATASAGLGWIAVVAAEYVGSSTGLGNLIISASSTLGTSIVVAGMFVIGLIGAGFSAAIRIAGRHTFDFNRKGSVT